MTTSLPSPVAQSAEGHYAHKLLNDLMENYSSALRPVEDTDLALNVTLQITLSQIKDMVSMSFWDLMLIILWKPREASEKNNIWWSLLSLFFPLLRFEEVSPESFL